MGMTADERFEFDVKGFLHFRGALPPDEVATLNQWIEKAKGADIKALNNDYPEGVKHQLNRPVSRMFDADPRFLKLLDHPFVLPYLVETLGEDFKHIDNDLFFSHPGYEGGGWHRGVQVPPDGFVRDGKFTCSMVKIFYCMTDVGPGEGEFVIVPGSHKAKFEIDMSKRVDLPCQHVFNNVKAGDIIIFNEGLLHNGRPNPSQKTRRTLIVNYGRHDAGVWCGYKPQPETLAAATPCQREILTNTTDAFWNVSRQMG